MPLRYNIEGSPIQDFAYRESSLMEDGLFLVIFLELPVESSPPDDIVCIYKFPDFR